MGKISEALQKSEKEKAKSSPRRPVINNGPTRWDAAASATIAEPVLPADDQDPLPEGLPPDMEPAAAPEDTSPAVHPDPPPATDTSPPTVKPVAPAIQRKPTRQPEKRPVSDIAFTKKKAPVESRPEHKAYTGPKPDGSNIALVSKETSSAPSPVQRLAREPLTGDKDAGLSETGVKTPRKRVSVRYSRTKIQVNDPEKLRNNKVFSVFDDMETTDQIKILRTQVIRKLKAIGGNSLLITSANPYEGKTFTSINLGVSIAKEFDLTVLIIDADIRRPTRDHTSFATEFFSLNVEKGLTDYLIGEADISDILINPGIDKLTLIPGGVPVENSPELLNSGRMEEMMHEIKSRYSSDRVVIVDGPAILPFPDASILSRYVDGVLPVVEMERTSNKDLKKMMLRLKDVNILGMVLNKNKDDG
jgi:protein-tyrosine kinase